MSQEYSRSALKVCVAQICQHLGWNSIYATPLELLTDVLERYLSQLGRVTHTYSEQFGRTDPRLEDVQLAFGHMGVQLNELFDYVKHVDPLPYAKDVVAYPVPRENDLKFPNPDSREIQQRKVFEFVPEHLPYMHPELNEDNEDSNPLPPGSPERLQVEQQTSEMSPGQGEKRLLSSPGDQGASFKRPRMMTSQLPEEALHSQYEMTSVVMTNSGILSPLREGKLPDSKTPPSGYKQIVIVKQKSGGQGAPTPGVKLGSDTPIIKLDFSKESLGTGKIIEVGDRDSGVGGQVIRDRGDPDFNPKKKKEKLFKQKKMQLKDFKIKRGPGRPRSPGRATVVHNKGTADLTAKLFLPKKDDSLRGMKKVSADVQQQDAPMDLSLKPTPAPHGINVKVDELAKGRPEYTHKSVEYRPKIANILSKQQEKDMEDTIDSVIEKSSREVDKRKIDAAMLYHQDKISPIEKLVREEAKQKVPGSEWRVSHISETYDDSFERDNDSESKDNRSFPRPELEHPNLYSSMMHTAPHLALLHTTPRPRGRPRGSGSGFYRGLSRGIPGRKPGRPPLNRSPGRPHISRSPGRPPLSRSPGRPPLNRSPGPGRPPSGRSPGRPPGSGRSPGRPKGSVSQNWSPKPRGRPRGSKSPRGRGASPRGGSPRAIVNINFDENTSENNLQLKKVDSEDSEATMFEFPSNSPVHDREEKETTPVPVSIPKEEHNERVPSRAGSEKSETREPSPAPPPRLVLSVKKEPTPEFVIKEKEPDFVKQEIINEVEVTSRDVPDMDRNLHSSMKENDYRFYEKEENREYSRDREHKHHSKEREHKEHSREKEYKDSSKEREHREHNHREHKREHKEHSKEREHKEHSKEHEHKEISKEREHKEHSKEREHKEHSKEREHKEHSKEKEHNREREHSKDRDRSKEHKKDKKKKKKKDKDKEKERDRERDKDKDRKEKHSHKLKEKETREESPSVQPLVQKLKIKFGVGSSSSFSISKPVPSPKPESASPSNRPEIPKLKFKVLPPKSDSASTPERENSVDRKTQSWVSSIKIKSEESSVEEPFFSSHPSVSPAHKHPTSYEPLSPKFKPIPAVHGESENDTAGKNDMDEEDEEEHTVSVIKGKIMGTKKLKKKKESSKKGRPKTGASSAYSSSSDISGVGERFPAHLHRESVHEASPSPPTLFSEQNVPSPITIPALKAAPPPPSPPIAKKSPPKPRLNTKEVKPQSPLVREAKPRPPPVQIPKNIKVSKSPRRSSPRKSPKISPPTKRKGGLFPQVSPSKSSPPSKSSSSLDLGPRGSPPPSGQSSPIHFEPSPPMYSPDSSPGKESLMGFMIPPATTFPAPAKSPSPTPPFRQLSTDDETEAAPAVETVSMPPPTSPLPPMPPTSSAVRKAQRTVVAETIGSFVNASGEKVWICPSCTMQDDGSPMIGCDICDDWYHWPCVGIKEEPEEEESWYCSKCVKPSKTKAKRGRKKKKP